LREMDDKSLNSKNNILVVSGALDKTAVEKIIATGVKSFLPKPFTEADFQEKILKILGIK
jgi:response regulator of citrate/malate metabolism